MGPRGAGPRCGARTVTTPSSSSGRRWIRWSAWPWGAPHELLAGLQVRWLVAGGRGAPRASAAAGDESRARGLLERALTLARCRAAEVLGAEDRVELELAWATLL